MNDVTKIVLGIVGALLLFVLIMLVAGFIYLMMIGNAFNETYGYSDEELEEYISSEHGRNIDVLESAERTFLGLFVSDAKVKTKDRQNVVFTISVNMLGHVSGDDFKDVEKTNINQEYADFEPMQGLEELGIENIGIGEQRSDRDLDMKLPSDSNLEDKASFDLIYDALPYIQDLDDEVSEDTGYPLKYVYINNMILDVDEAYDSPEELRNEMANDNIDEFAGNLIIDDKEKLEDILFDLDYEYGTFDDNGVNPDLHCNAMDVYDECDEYTLTLQTSDADFIRYDDASTRKDVMSAVDILREVDLPLETIEIDSIKVPENPDDQSREVDDDALHKTRVKITDLENIHSEADIVFEYE